MFWRIILTYFAGWIMFGLLGTLCTPAGLLKKIGRTLNAFLPELKGRLPMLVTLPVLLVSLVYVIRTALSRPDGFTPWEYVFTLTPIGNVGYFFIDLDELRAAGMSFWEAMALFVFRAGIAGIEAHLIGLLASSFYASLKGFCEKMGAFGGVTAFLLGYFYIFLVSPAVSSLDRFIDFSHLTELFLAGPGGILWVGILLLFLFFLGFFAFGWFADIVLFMIRWIGIEMICRAVAAIMKWKIPGTVEDIITYVIVGVLTAYWMLREMNIEALEDWVEDQELFCFKYLFY